MSDEQPDPDAALRAAVEASVNTAAREAGATEGLLCTGFVIIASTVGFDDAGERVTAVTTMPSSELATYQCLGLLEEAAIRFKAFVLAKYANEDE